jgi:hypothetical protein
MRPVLVGWLLTVGVDLFFNAGLFANLFDQDREPGLLSDPVLFRRIPVAYLGLAVGVAALAWLLDKADLRGVQVGARVGGLAGAVFALVGVVGLWTALEMTGLFVAAAVLVQIIEFAAAGAFLGAYRQGPGNRSVRVALIVAFGLALAGIIIQNLLTS